MVLLDPVLPPLPVTIKPDSNPQKSDQKSDVMINNYDLDFDWIKHVRGILQR